MKLNKLLKNINILELKGDLDIEIKGVENDSRKIKEGDLFIAVEGFEVDGHNFIEKAILDGAKAVIGTKNLEFEGITYVKVSDIKVAMAEIASSFYNSPSKDLEVIGITGTNGKTSITYMLKQILDIKNNKVGLIGTMGSIIDNKKINNKNTTPESLEVQRQLSQMVKYDSDFCVMEVSSHSIEMKRVNNIDFNIGIFTNLTEDHLDYHLNMNNYYKAKRKFFDMTKDVNIINFDDVYGKKIVKSLEEDNKIIKYGLTKESDVYATNINLHNKGVDFDINYKNNSIAVSLNLLGKFNIYNALASAACALYYGFSMEDVKLGLESITGIDGRFELIPIKEDYSVIIDFAHTPDGLEQVLTTIDQFTAGRKIVVFGAGGNRDRLKRPIMGETVASHADLSIITSDNPRKEIPEQIIEDIELGVKKISNNYIKITDRREAIKYAIKIARKGDTILLAGKGHETYIILENEVIPFDEKEIVLEIIEELKGEQSC